MLSIRRPRPELEVVPLLALAAAVRYWGIGFGLPHTETRPDEPFLINIAIKFGTGDLNPHIFLWPTLYMYVLYGLYGLYYAAGRLTGAYGSIADFEREFVVDPSRFYLIDRLLSATLGVATILFVYLLAVRWLGRATARLAAFFLSLAYLHARDSHFGVIDVAMTFLIVASTLLIAESERTRAPRHVLAAGLLAGLATGAKYAGAALVVPMLIAHGLAARRLVSFGLAMSLAFALAVPYALLDFGEFWRQLRFQVGYTQAGGHLGATEPGIWHIFRFSLLHGLGWPLLGAGLLGALLLLARDRRRAAVLLSFPVAYLLFFGTARVSFVRYGIPLVPFLCITAAYAVATLGALLPGRARAVVPTVLALLIVLPSTINLLSFDLLLTRIDNRLLVAEWINQNVPEGSSIGQVGERVGRVQLAPSLESLRRASQTELGPVERRALEAKIAHARTGRVPGFDVWSYDQGVGGFVADGEVKAGLPDYLLVIDSPLIAFRQIPPAIPELVAERYRPVRSFVAIDADQPDRAYDQEDAFYVPFVGFAGVERPGPNLYLYQRLG